MSKVNPPPVYSSFSNIYPDKISYGRVVFAIACGYDRPTGKAIYFTFPAEAKENEFEEVLI
jgi:hypothetical protein